MSGWSASRQHPHAAETEFENPFLEPELSLDPGDLASDLGLPAPSSDEGNPNNSDIPDGADGTSESSSFNSFTDAPTRLDQRRRQGGDIGLPAPKLRRVEPPSPRPAPFPPPAVSNRNSNGPSGWSAGPSVGFLASSSSEDSRGTSPVYSPSFSPPQSPFEFSLPGEWHPDESVRPARRSSASAGSQEPSRFAGVGPYIPEKEEKEKEVEKKEKIFTSDEDDFGPSLPLLPSRYVPLSSYPRSRLFPAAPPAAPRLARSAIPRPSPPAPAVSRHPPPPPPSEPIDLTDDDLLILDQFTPSSAPSLRSTATSSAPSLSFPSPRPSSRGSTRVSFDDLPPSAPFARPPRPQGIAPSSLMLPRGFGPNHNPPPPRPPLLSARESAMLTFFFQQPAANREPLRQESVDEHIARMLQMEEFTAAVLITVQQEQFLRSRAVERIQRRFDEMSERSEPGPGRFFVQRRQLIPASLSRESFENPLATYLRMRHGMGIGPLGPPAAANVRGRMSLMFRDLTENDYELLLALDEDVESTKGAKEGEISLLPQVTIGEGEAEKCCICLSEMEVGTSARVLPCKHRFHPECIERWLKINKVCPIDKKRIDGSDMPEIIDLDVNNRSQNNGLR